MKKILMIFLVLFINNLWSNDTLDNEIDVESNNIIELFKNEKVDAIVIGKVLNLSVNLYKRKHDEELSIKNIFSVTTVEFEVKKAYKKNNIKKIIKVIIPGGEFLFEGKKYIYASNDTANPLLDEGDVILMGLKILENGSYRHVFGKKLQIPYSDKLIEDIENQKKEHKLRKLQKKKKKNKNINTISSYLSEDDILETSLNEKSKKKGLVREITKKLNLSFSKSEVINE